MDVKTLRNHLSAVPNEYSYFDTKMLSVWAGPKHWKFKPFRRDPVPTLDEERRKRQKTKEKEKLSFDQLDKDDDPFSIHTNKAMTLPKKTTKLQNKTMLNWTEEKNVLPEDPHYSGKDLVKLETVIRMNVAPRNNSESQSVDESVGDYNYGNANDSQNFCPDMPVTDQTSYPAMQDSDTGLASAESDIFGISTGPADGDIGLVAAPNKVEKVQIGYAKLAKKIDMRKLKHVEWEILNESMASAANKENSTNDLNKTADDDESTSSSQSIKSITSFKDLYHTLQGPSQLPSKMKENLSVPLAFVALLHLCNEQVLELESDSDLKNLLIRKA